MMERANDRFIEWVLLSGGADGELDRRLHGTETGQTLSTLSREFCMMTWFIAAPAHVPSDAPERVSPRSLPLHT